jgi:ankyrin repeat protein
MESAIRNAGHPLEVSIQFEKPPRNFKQTSDQLPSPLTDLSLNPRDQGSPSKSVFEQNEERQKRAWDLLHRASKEPSYVDPVTGDNALHALSRVRFPQTRSHLKILSSIRAFVSKDSVDLNLQNREQESPLTAIICHRPFQGIESDETGATMSKYLDALLWKDPLRRIPNKINVNMRNRKGATALYYAAIRGRPDSVRSLIEAGANVNVRLSE